MKKLNTISSCLLLLPLLFVVGCFNIIQDRVAADEASAVGSLRTLNTANQVYAEEHKTNFGSELGDFSGLIDRNLLSGQKSGYRFRYTPGKANKKGIVDTYEIVAEPIDRDKTGDRYFFTDQTGMIRYGIGSVNAQSALL